MRSARECWSVCRIRTTDRRRRHQPTSRVGRPPPGLKDERLAGHRSWRLEVAAKSLYVGVVLVSCQLARLYDDFAYQFGDREQEGVVVVAGLCDAGGRADVNIGASCLLEHARDP